MAANKTWFFFSFVWTLSLIYLLWMYIFLPHPVSFPIFLLLHLLPTGWQWITSATNLQVHPCVHWLNETRLFFTYRKQVWTSYLINFFNLHLFQWITAATVKRACTNLCSKYSSPSPGWLQISACFCTFPLDKKENILLILPVLSRWQQV